MSTPVSPNRVLDFLGRVFIAAVFVNALPGKFTDFAGNAARIASKGIPEPLANVLLFAAILVLIAGSILLVFGADTILGASLLLVFLVPTTLVFYASPFQAVPFLMNLALIGGLILAITRSTANPAPNFRKVRAKAFDSIRSMTSAGCALSVQATKNPHALVGVMDRCSELHSSKTLHIGEPGWVSQISSSTLSR